MLCGDTHAHTPHHITSHDIKSHIETKTAPRGRNWNYTNDTSIERKERNTLLPEKACGSIPHSPGPLRLNHGRPQRVRGGGEGRGQEGEGGRGWRITLGTGQGGGWGGAGRSVQSFRKR